MSIYERRFNYVTRHNNSCYSDEVQDVLDGIRRHGATHVAIGYADEEYLRDGRIMFTRRTERVLTAEEFIAEFDTDNEEATS